MEYDIMNIRAIRKRLGITQHQLAKSAGVSQSMIAKIESGKLDPAHSKALQIFKALETFVREKEKKATEVMTSNVLIASPDNLAKNEIKIMRQKGISQIPVVQNGILIGNLTESDVVNNLDKITSKTKISEIMSTAPPTVSEDTPISAVTGLLKFSNSVLVIKGGKIKGIITKADLLG